MSRKHKGKGTKLPSEASVSKPVPKQSNSTVSNLSASPPRISSEQEEEADNQFVLELHWCVEQLHGSLNSGKLSLRQKLEISTTLKLLENKTVARIKKRQLMRSTFGDYRAKMKEEEKKFGKYISNIKFVAPGRCTSVYLAKAGEQRKTPDRGDDCGSEKSDSNKTFVMSKEPSEVPFKFNFSEPESE